MACAYTSSFKGQDVLEDGEGGIIACVPSSQIFIFPRTNAFQDKINSKVQFFINHKVNFRFVVKNFLDLYILLRARCNPLGQYQFYLEERRELDLYPEANVETRKGWIKKIRTQWSIKKVEINEDFHITNCVSLFQFCDVSVSLFQFATLVSLCFSFATLVSLCSSFATLVSLCFSFTTLVSLCSSFATLVSLCSSFATLVSLCSSFAT